MCSVLKNGTRRAGIRSDASDGDVFSRGRILLAGGCNATSQAVVTDNPDSAIPFQS